MSLSDLVAYRLT